MATNVRHRPFGISLIAVLVIIGGVMDIIGGILSIANRSDVNLLVELKATKSEVTWFGILLIVVGAIAILVGLMLWKGSPIARILVGVIVALRLVGTVWAFVSFDKSHWYEGIGSVIIYAFVAWYVLADKNVKEFFTARV